MLAEHLAENAALWGRILEGVDATSLEVFGRLEAVALAWAALQRAVLAPQGLNYAELVTLGMLRTSTDSRCPLAELRGLVGQSSAGMTRILDKLVAEGLVVRDGGGSDRRRIDVRLTERGANVAEKAHEAMLRHQSRLLAGLEGEERDALCAALDGLLRAFQARS